MDKIAINNNIYLTSCIDRMNWCNIWFFLLCWLNFFHCHQIYDQWLMLNYNDMIFPCLYFFIHYFIIYTNIRICISLFLQNNESIKKTLVFNVDKRKFWFSYKIITVWCIKMRLFANSDVWIKSRTSPLLRIIKIFLLCFLLDNVNTINIYFTFVK